MKKISTIIMMFCFSLGAMQKIEQKPNSSQPLGLVNQGKTCYMNAALQNLINIKPLRDFAGSVHDKVYFKKDSVGDRFSSLVHALNVAASSEKSIQPVAFCESLPSMGLQKGKQEDAAEFLTQFIDRLSNGDIESSAGSHGGVEKLFQYKVGEIRWDEALKKTKTREYVESGSSGVILSLPIVAIVADEGKRKITTLGDALYAYFSPEVVEGMKINGEKAQVPMKRMVFETLPPYLVISLNRFSSDRSKLKNPVSFPERLTLTFLSERSPDRSNNSYKLLGIVIHSGSFGRGHYMAYIRRGSTWYFCDDSQVKTVSSQEVTNTMKSGDNEHGTPYVLFYENTKKKGQLPEATQFAKRNLPQEKLLEIKEKEKTVQKRSGFSRLRGDESAVVEDISSYVYVLNKTGKDLYIKSAPYSRWGGEESSDGKPLWGKIGNKAAYSERLSSGHYPQMFLASADPQEAPVMLTQIKLDPRDERVTKEKRRDVIVEVTQVGDRLVIKPQRGTWVSLKKETRDKIVLKDNISSSNDLIIKMIRSSDVGISQPQGRGEFVKGERVIDPRIILAEVVAAYKFGQLPITKNTTQDEVRAMAMKTTNSPATAVELLGFEKEAKPTFNEINQRSAELHERLEAIRGKNYGDKLMVKAINEAITLLEKTTNAAKDPTGKAQGAVSKIHKAWNIYKGRKQSGAVAYALLTRVLGKKTNEKSAAWEKLGMTQEDFGDPKKRNEQYNQLESLIQEDKTYPSDVISQALNIIEMAYSQEKEEGFRQESDIVANVPIVRDDSSDEYPFAV